MKTTLLKLLNLKLQLNLNIVLVSLFLAPGPLTQLHAQDDCDTNCQNINALRETISKQGLALQKLQDTVKTLTTVQGVPEAIHPVAYKKSSLVFNPPLTIESEGGFDGIYSFGRPTVLSENNWDWSSDDAWTIVRPPAAGPSTTVYARLTFSLTSGSHWSPCFTLRRRNKEAGALKVVGKQIDLPCYSSIGKRDSKPASISLWVEWWNTDMPLKEWGTPSQTLEIAGKNFGSTGASPWSLRSLEIELYRSLK